MEIRFYTQKMRGVAVAHFVLPFTVDLPNGRKVEIICRGEIIDSPRDRCLVVQWPRMKDGWWAMTGATQADTETLSTAILHLYHAWKNRGAAR